MAWQRPNEGWGICIEPPNVTEERLKQEAEFIKQAQLTGAALEESLAAQSYKRQQARAHQQLGAWERKTGFQRPEACEICGVTSGDIKSNIELWIKLGVAFPERKRFIIGHHWRGYEYPLDVWWICYSCNSRLWGKHDGSLSIEEARQYVKHIGARHEPNPEKDAKVRQFIEFEKTDPSWKSLREFGKSLGIIDQFD